MSPTLYYFGRGLPRPISRRALADECWRKRNGGTDQMQIILELDEAWSLMSTITSYLIDKSGVSQDGKQVVRRWRTDRASGTVEMNRLAIALNEALCTYLDDKTARMVRQKGRYQSVREKEL